MTRDLNRLPGLDALRATMMLLGLVLHSAASYTDASLGEAWPYKDARTSALLDLLIAIIHLFRMPTFFVMAGFFAALLYYRDGAAGFLKQRTARLLLPLIAAWILLFPVMVFGFSLAQIGGGLQYVKSALQSTIAAPYQLARPGHLWFIYYLFIFCVAAASVAPLLGRLPGATRASGLAAFGRTASTTRGCVALGVLSGITMLPMSGPMIDTPIGFVPVVSVLVAYGVFFVFGWLLFARRDLVPWFGKHPGRHVKAGLLMSAVYLPTLLQPWIASTVSLRIASVMAGGVATWLLVYGVTGLFVKHVTHPSPRWRYASDGSYWIYLVHLPVIGLLVGLLAPVDLPVFAKFGGVLIGTTLVTTATYHFFVRSTVIGAFLNGRRFDRRLPRGEHELLPKTSAGQS